MGLGLLRGDQTVASTELYVDKVVKFISGLAQLLLGVVIVVLAHGTSLLSCLSVILYGLLKYVDIVHNAKVFCQSDVCLSLVFSVGIPFHKIL